MMRPPSRVPEIDVTEAHRRLTGEAGKAATTPLLVDVRNRDEFAAARIPGSVLVPLPFLAGRIADLPADRPVLLVCRSGNRSATAAAMLLRQGYEEVASVAGGIVAWYQAGLPVTTGPLEPDEDRLPGR